MRLILASALAFAAVAAAEAEDFVFETRMVRLAIRPDGVAGSLIDRHTGKERLGPDKVAFAAVRKSGRLYQASAARRSGNLLHVAFGSSGVEADYRITARAEYIVVELAGFRGDGVEEIRLAQLSVPLANAGELLSVRWDEEFAVCLMGLSERVDSGMAGSVTRASVYPEFGMRGERVAIIASPTLRLLEVVREVERDFRLPSPTLGGRWAKRSEDVRTSYLFTDLTEANADATIRYAKLGGFRYILVYSGTWSASLGSYPINTLNFPGGESSLKRTIDRCHAAGLKVGMHMLTSFVGKNDPLVRPALGSGLLKDAEGTLAEDVGERAVELTAASVLKGFPAEPQPYGPARDVLIDQEIIEYQQVDGARLRQCVRGLAGTRPAPHKAGARIYHLAERDSAYLADLRTPLADAIAERVAGVINRCGFDMIYFDGREVNGANGSAWYWLAPQQAAIWRKSKRPLLVQGSGMTHWTWHIFSRDTCDDAPAAAVKEYLDYHKIGDRWRAYHNNFLPADLGWWGFFADARDSAATTPDEVEYYAVRMLALDSAGSLETSLGALEANGRTGEMLKLLGDYEQLRRSGAVPEAMRRKLETGEWHMTRPGEFHPIRYDAQMVEVPGSVTVRNAFDEQPLKFRLRAVPALSAAGDPANVRLLRPEPPLEIPPPEAQSSMPGELVRHIEFTKAVNLAAHRALAVRLEVEGQIPGSAGRPVLNVQLEAVGKRYRDYYIDLDFSGMKTVLLTEPGTSRMLAEFRPAEENYPFKAAMGRFNYGSVVALNLRWMRYPSASRMRCRISLVEALAERNGAFRDFEISLGTLAVSIPGEMKTGDYAEYWGEGAVRVFDRNGVLLRTAAAERAPVLAAGENRLAVRAAGPGTVKLTAITLGR